MIEPCLGLIVRLPVCEHFFFWLIKFFLIYPPENGLVIFLEHLQYLLWCIWCIGTHSTLIVLVWVFQFGTHTVCTKQIQKMFESRFCLKFSTLLLVLKVTSEWLKFLFFLLSFFFFYLPIPLKWCISQS